MGCATSTPGADGSLEGGTANKPTYEEMVKDNEALRAIVNDTFPTYVADKMVEERKKKLQKSRVLEEAQQRSSLVAKQQQQAPPAEGSALAFIQGFVRLEADAAQKLEAPTHTLAATMAGGQFSDTFDSVTVLFTDIVGFTAWASKASPEIVFHYLGQVYREFDRLARKFGIYKVKTIGDSYMAVCGIPEPTSAPEHAVRMADFALAIRSKHQQLARDAGTHLGVRIGMHSGSVLAGVLLGERSRFQLFGDTVNYASRMESTCEPGKIQVSPESRLLLVEAGFHELEFRGKINPKGKGEIETYYAPQQAQLGAANHLWGQHAQTVCHLRPTAAAVRGRRGCKVTGSRGRRGGWGRRPLRGGPPRRLRRVPDQPSHGGCCRRGKVTRPPLAAATAAAAALARAASQPAG